MSDKRAQFDEALKSFKGEVLSSAERESMRASVMEHVAANPVSTAASESATPSIQSSVSASWFGGLQPVLVGAMALVLVVVVVRSGDPRIDTNRPPSTFNEPESALETEAGGSSEERSIRLLPVVPSDTSDTVPPSTKTESSEQRETETPKDEPRGEAVEDTPREVPSAEPSSAPSFAPAPSANFQFSGEEAPAFAPATATTTPSEPNKEDDDE